MTYKCRKSTFKLKSTLQTVNSTKQLVINLNWRLCRLNEASNINKICKTEKILKTEVCTCTCFLKIWILRFTVTKFYIFHIFCEIVLNVINLKKEILIKPFKIIFELSLLSWGLPLDLTKKTPLKPFIPDTKWVTQHIR